MGAMSTSVVTTPVPPNAGSGSPAAKRVRRSSDSTARADNEFPMPGKTTETVADFIGGDAPRGRAAKCNGRKGLERHEPLQRCRVLRGVDDAVEDQRLPPVHVRLLRLEHVEHRAGVFQKDVV